MSSGEAIKLVHSSEDRREFIGRKTEKRRIQGNELPIAEEKKTGRFMENHERRLMHWLHDGGKAILYFRNGDTIDGKVIGFDSETVTIDENFSGNRDDAVTVYKHDLSMMRYETVN